MVPTEILAEQHAESLHAYVRTCRDVNSAFNELSKREKETGVIRSISRWRNRYINWNSCVNSR